MPALNGTKAFFVKDNHNGRLRAMDLLHGLPIDQQDHKRPSDTPDLDEQNWLELSNLSQSNVLRIRTRLNFARLQFNSGLFGRCIHALESDSSFTGKFLKLYASYIWNEKQIQDQLVEAIRNIFLYSFLNISYSAKHEERG